MAVGKLIGLGVSYLIGIFWSYFVIFRTIIRYLKDPSQNWGVTVRKERPLCLKSTAKWTHNLVTLQHDGIQLHYVSAGSLDKPLMVLLHGFPEMWLSWRHQLEHFKENYRVVALSMRGYGDSDAPSAVARYRIPLLVEDVKGLVRSLGANDCVLVGHDWGGAVAWRVASDAPEIVSKLIILNCPHSGAFSRAAGTMKQFLMSWYMFFFQLPWIPEYLYTRCNLGSLRVLWKMLGLDHEEEKAFEYFYSQPGALTGPINYYRSGFRHAPTAFRHALGNPQTARKVRMPTLLIWGTKDLALCEEMAAMSADYCDDIRIKKIHGGNHFIQQDKPEEVNALMEEFLREKC